MHRHGALQAVGLLVHRPVVLGADMVLEAVGGEHRPHHAQFLHATAQFLDGFCRILHRNEPHGLETGVPLQVGLVKPIVVGLCKSDGPVQIDDVAEGQSVGGIQDSRVNAYVIGEIDPSIDTDRGE